MDTSAEGLCPHDVRCVNCLGKENSDHTHPSDARRCPTRLAKYGTARENEKRAAKSENPWIRAKPGKRNKPKPTNEETQARYHTNNATNRYDPIASNSHQQSQQAPHAQTNAMEP
jgi:hypothetical protein